MTLIEAAKRVQAAWRDPQGMPEWCKEMDALGQAIAEAEQQKPVAWLHPANPTCVTTNPTAYARGIPLVVAHHKATPDHTEQHLGMVGKQEPAQQDGPINDGWQITVAHGHSGYGVYAHMEDYPEEGAVLVQVIEQQEPVAYVAGYFSGRVVVEPVNRALVMNTGTALYTTPPQRKPLTDEQCEDAIRTSGLWPLACVTPQNKALLIGLCRAAHGITPQGETK